jgi:preprotein translocase subunit SecB
MNNSPLQLDRSFVGEVAVTTNKEFDIQKPVNFLFQHIKVHCENRLLNAERRQWECTLRIQLQAPPENNLPYAFVTEWVGLFRVLQGWQPEKDETLVVTSAPAVLFSMAREHIRNIMASGPYAPLLLPTVNFTDAAPKVGSADHGFQEDGNRSPGKIVPAISE